jgi:hypothetical protein
VRAVIPLRTKNKSRPVKGLDVDLGRNGRVDGVAERLVVLDGLLDAGSNVGAGDAELLVHLLGGSGSTVGRKKVSQSPGTSGRGGGDVETTGKV